MNTILAQLTPEIIIGGLLIFLARTVDMCLDTLRVLFVVRGKKVVVWILGVIQSIIYIAAISNVLKGDNNPFTILCYACGFATGNILGMFIESRLAIGFKEINVVSRTEGTKIAAALREQGYGVTEILGQGRDGIVTMVRTNVKRKQVADVRRIIEAIDANAFITEDDYIPVNSGGHYRK